MTCGEYQQLTSEFIDGELKNEQTRILFEHLGMCDSCWRYYRRIERLHSVLAEDPDSAQLRILKERRERTESQWLRQVVSLRSSSVLLGFFMAFILGLLCSLFILSSGESESTDTGGSWTLQNYPVSSSVSLQNPGNHVPSQVSPR